MYNAFVSELKQAEELMTEVELQRKKEADAKKEQEAAYAKTDAGVIKKNIKTAFWEWNQKGEFEKETDYTIRLKNQSKETFEKICLEQIKKRIKEIRDYNSSKDYNTSSLQHSYNFMGGFVSLRYKNTAQKELLTYDSKNEIFPITFKFNGLIWQNQINIPISQAENFKKNWREEFSEVTINEQNWCFIENYLCPTLVVFEVQNAKYELPLSVTNQSDIIYTFSDLGIDNSYLKGYVFSLSEIRRVAEEKRLAELEYNKYSQKLDSVFKDYNRQLLQHPFNGTKIKLADYKKMEKEGNRAENFNFCVKMIESDFEKLFNELKNGVKVFDELQADVSTIKSLNFKDVSNGKDLLAKKYFLKIGECKDKPYYSKIVDFVVETNNGLNKEWVKNGKFFGGKIKFYEAYISNYKEKLKENKK